MNETSTRRVFVIPATEFWKNIGIHAQPLTRLGLSMPFIVQLASDMLTSSPLQRGGSTAPNLARSRGYVSAGLDHIETLRSYVRHELAELHPDLLTDHRELDKLTYTLVDAIERARNYLCEYATMLIGYHDPSLQLDRFIGPQLDLAISYNYQPGVSFAHAHLPPVRNPEPSPAYVQYVTGALRNRVQ